MPADSNQAAAMAEKALETIAEGHESIYIFSARSSHEQLKSPDGSIIYGADYTYNSTADIIRGAGGITDNATIIATGITVHDALAAADALSAGQEKLNVRVLNVSSVRPIDAAAIIQSALETRHLIVVEDHNSDGGLATQVADVIADFALPCTLRRMGLRHYFPSGNANDLKFLAGLDSDSIADAVLDEVCTEVCGGEDELITTIYELVHNTQESRFRDQALVFVEKLLEEKGYLESLREYWKSTACSPEEMPETEDLLMDLDKLRSL